MRLAVVQHRLRPAPAQDIEALVIASAKAAAREARALVLPDVLALRDGPLRDDLMRRLEEAVPRTEVIVPRPGGIDAAPYLLRESDGLGRLALLWGDACMDPDVLAAVQAAGPGLAVLWPGAESELQAQAVLELAVPLSTSLASVIVVVEPDGAELGDPGHGSSAVVHLGQVLAEAMRGDDLLVVDLPAPLGPPEARALLPQAPPVLTQRLAAHRGHKVAVDYPADLG
ncbi:MAG: hypothetical protein ACYC6J_02860 [Coriobacteriia bacterium]